MQLTISTPNNYSIKNITENHIEITNYGYKSSSILKLYEINYDHSVKYPNVTSLNMNNLSLCDDMFTIQNAPTKRCGS